MMKTSRYNQHKKLQSNREEFVVQNRSKTTSCHVELTVVFEDRKGFVEVCIPSDYNVGTRDED
jgi:hypothetical protein